MPIITVNMHHTDDDVKKGLIKNLTETAVAATGIPKEHFTVLIHELGGFNIGLGGQSLEDVLKSNHS